ncbi:MAG: type III-B CRISPR module RAMP protein Cmr1 [Dissulfuribacterales bacterium]
MSINIARFYKQERMEFDCEIITPMFLGNSNQEAELRAAPFKGLLRYWWRVAEGYRYDTPAALLKAENAIFGSADEDGGKSQVKVEVSPLTDMVAKKDPLPTVAEVDHPECERTRQRTNPLNYLAGMGLIHYKNGILHSYFKPGEKFKLCLTVSDEKRESIQLVLELIKKFGAIGSRSRNGWGCFSFANSINISDSLFIKSFQNAFDRDYPHCLGKDNEGLLLWKTKNSREKWELCMRDLAEIYISIRAGNANLNIQRLDVINGSPPERHLLGYPVTNHSVNLPNWGNQGRHGSALRLIVRKEDGNYHGYILHLPHLFSTAMWQNDKNRQIEIWKKVHGSLDKLCQRATI